MAHSASALAGATVSGAGSRWSATALGISGATLYITDNGTLAVATGMNIAASGALSLTDGVVSTTSLFNSGALGGTGRITADVYNIGGGIVGPGNSPGLLTIDGDFSQDSGSTSIFELGGTGQGVSYDWLDITGTATLAGELQVNFIDGFSASAGDTFDLLTAGAILGGFDTLSLAALGEDLIWNVEVLTDALGSTDMLRLSVSQVPVPPAVWLFGSALVGLGYLRRKHIA